MNNFNFELLRDRFCQAFCAEVKLKPVSDLYWKVVTPFSFPDGDSYQIYLREGYDGGIRISDGGHTLMQLSYEINIDTVKKGARGKLMEDILKEEGAQMENGEIFFLSDPNLLAVDVFRLGKTITRIYDLNYLSRERTATVFYEDLEKQIYSIVPSELVTKDYLVPTLEEKEDYPIDFYIPGKGGMSFFIFGVNNKDKAKLTSVILERLRRFEVLFESLIVFEKSDAIPRSDMDRLMNVGDEFVSSIGDKQDLQRKIIRKADLPIN